MNELLNAEEKSVSITIKITPTMNKEIKKLMKKKKWRLSAFVRVAIQESMNRVD